MASGPCRLLRVHAFGHQRTQRGLPRSVSCYSGHPEPSRQRRTELSHLAADLQYWLLVRQLDGTLVSLDATDLTQSVPTGSFGFSIVDLTSTLPVACCYPGCHGCHCSPVLVACCLVPFT